MDNEATKLMEDLMEKRRHIDTLIEKIEDLNNLILSLQICFKHRNQVNEGVRDIPDRVLLKKIAIDCSELLETAQDMG
jgi:uncharacterized protein YoxC